VPDRSRCSSHLRSHGKPCYSLHSTRSGSPARSPEDHDCEIAVPGWPAAAPAWRRTPVDGSRFQFHSLSTAASFRFYCLGGGPIHQSELRDLALQPPSSFLLSSTFCQSLLRTISPRPPAWLDRVRARCENPRRQSSAAGGGKRRVVRREAVGLNFCRADHEFASAKLEVGDCGHA